MSVRARTTLPIVALAAAAGALPGCGGGSGGAPTTTPTAHRTTTAGPALVARLRAPGHHPRAAAKWSITVTLRWNGRPARGHISYRFLFAGRVVSRQRVGGESPNFSGVFHDTIEWPRSAVGYPLTFEVVVTSPHGTKLLDYPVQVTR